jgi:Amt family ammonium transporter
MKTSLVLLGQAQGQGTDSARDAGSRSADPHAAAGEGASLAGDLGRLQRISAFQASGLARQLRELEESRDAALAANRLKSEFLANMSHEIRTPMTAILGFTEEVLEEARRMGLSDEITRALLTIRRNGEHLLEIINDILDLSKIEADRITIERIRCSPSEILVDVAWLMRQRALEKRLKLEVELEAPVPETIRTDPTRLRQILLNLASNAIKFTEEGGVILRARMAGAPMRDGTLMIFEVVDTGIGLTDEQKRQIFEAFSQADSATTRKFGGTGLGLTISRRLARLLGGDIAVESARGRGSTFRVSVAAGSLDGVSMIETRRAARIAHEREKPEATGRVAELSGRVLVAEDGSDNQQLLSLILTKAGLDVDVADNGRVAYEKAVAAAVAGEPYDVILMDMQMPELDGYRATSLLREGGYEGPIIALTAHAMSGDREKCIEAGCDDYASKPVAKARLLGLVAYFIEKRSRES